MLCGNKLIKLVVKLVKLVKLVLNSSTRPSGCMFMYTLTNTIVESKRIK